ncbi:hypothetical protein ACX8XK_00105 [Serratia marcescens]
MTLTTERQQFAKQNEMSLEFVNWFFDEKKDGCGNAWFAMAAAMWEGWKGQAANREAQPVVGELGEIRVGRLPTMNQEEYPGLGDWWVQLRIGANNDEILARVYGATPDEAMARARALSAPPAPAAPEKCPERVRFLMSMHADDLFDDVGAQEIWNACRAAMLAQPVSGGYKLVPAEATEDMIAAAMNCDDVSFNADETFCVNFGNIYAAMLAAAPEGGNDHDTRR